MTDLLLSRRHFITGLSSLIVAPAVVRSASLMPVRALPPPEYPTTVYYQIYTDTLVLVQRLTFNDERRLLPIQNVILNASGSEVDRFREKFPSAFTLSEPNFVNMPRYGTKEWTKKLNT